MDSSESDRTAELERRLAAAGAEAAAWRQAAIDLSGRLELTTATLRAVLAEITRDPART